MKKLLGLVFVALLLAACSPEPVQGTFIDLREYREYSTVSLTFICSGSEVFEQDYQLANHAWVVDIQELGEALARDCDFPLHSGFPSASGVDFDDVIGAPLVEVVLRGSESKPDIYVAPILKDEPERVDVSIFFSRGQGRGTYEGVEPEDFHFENLVINKGWNLISGREDSQGRTVLNRTDIDSIKWVVIDPNT